MGGLMRNNTTIISIYQQGNSFVGFNNEDEIVMRYSIADPVMKAKAVLQWTEEGRFKGLLA
jgi:hypothetical protein